jgi:hypothetical protein
MAKGCAWIVKTQRHPCGRPRTLRPHSALQHGHTTFMSVPQDERVFIARRYAIHAARKPGVATRATRASPGAALASRNASLPNATSGASHRGVPSLFWTARLYWL